jgi:hypothetical protein
MKHDNDNQIALDPGRAGGVIGEVATWITDTAIKPLPALSTVSSLAMLAGMCGSRMLTPTGGGVNIYALGVNPTGSGKAHPPKASRRIANVVRPGSFNGGDPTSATAIERIIRETPGHSTCLHMDEFGITLQNINSKKPDGTAAGIRKFLLAIFDQGDSVFDGRAFAASSPDRKSGPIHGPALSLIATTTPDSLFAGLSEGVFSEGFFNRFIIVPPAPRPRREDVRVPGLDRVTSPSEKLIDLVTRSNDALPGGNFAGLQNMPHPKHRVPMLDGESGAAYRRWHDIFLEQSEMPEEIYGRLAENTMKLATLRAISSNSLAPTVGLDDIIWAESIVRAGCVWLADIARNKVAESTHHARRNAIMAAVETKGVVPFSKLLSAKGVGGGRDKLEVCNDLMWLFEAGSIKIEGGFDDAGRFFGTGSRISVPKAA